MENTIQNNVRTGPQSMMRTIMNANERSEPNPSFEIGISNTSEPGKKIQHDGVEFLRLLHVRHMMGLSNRHPAGPHDITFEFVRIFEEPGIVLGTQHNQRRHLNFGEPFICWGDEVLLGSGGENLGK